RLTAPRGAGSPPARPARAGALCRSCVRRPASAIRGHPGHAGRGIGHRPNPPAQLPFEAMPTPAPERSAGLDLDVLEPVTEEVERVRGPERASEEATAAFLGSVLARGGDRGALVARGKELDIDVEAGGTVIVARAHPIAPAEEGWRRRLLAVAESAARTVAAG